VGDDQDWPVSCVNPRSGRLGSSTGGRLARVGVEDLEAALVTATKSDSVDEVPV
jgi:hypothetical protein